MEKGSVEVNDLSKVYHLYNKSSDRLRETFSIKKKKYSKDHYALRDKAWRISRNSRNKWFGKVYIVEAYNRCGDSDNRGDKN